MVSPLQGLNLQGAPDQIAQSILGGRQAYERSQLNQQTLQQGQQQLSQGEYEQAVQRLGVMNRLATKARSIDDPSQRSQFISSINPDLLKSVGIDPAQVSTVGQDNQSLDALIAQTGAALPNKDFRKESVSTNQGLQVFDPSSGTYKAATGADGKPLTGAAYDPTVAGNVAAAKQNAQNTSDLSLKPQIASAVDTAKAGVELATKPIIESKTTAATEKAKIDAINAQSQNVASGKLGDATSLYDDLQKGDLNKIYGRGESKYPDFARSQEGLDMIAKRNQLIAMLKLGARGELKGQGAVSDSESAMVADAATLLNNPDISPALAKEALDRAMNVLRRNAGQTPLDTKKKDSTIGRFKIEVHD